jgi:hypothetical protein
MSARLPVKLRKTPGGYVIQCGPDQRSRLYLYVEDDPKRVDSRHLFPAEAEALAKEVARALRQSWVIANKHGG